MVIDTAHITDMIDTADIAVMMMIVDVMSIATGGMIIATGHMSIGIVGIIGVTTITKMSINTALSSAETHCGAFSAGSVVPVRR